MEPLILQTASEDAGKRLDAWLAEQTELTRSAVQKLMEEGRVTAAGKPLAKNTRRWTSCLRISRWTWCTRTRTSSW